MDLIKWPVIPFMWFSVSLKSACLNLRKGYILTKLVLVNVGVPTTSKDLQWMVVPRQQECTLLVAIVSQREPHPAQRGAPPCSLSRPQCWRPRTHKNQSSVSPLEPRSASHSAPAAVKKMELNHDCLEPRHSLSLDKPTNLLWLLPAPTKGKQ